MENQLQALKKMIELVVEDPCCSVDFLHMNLKSEKITVNCISKSGERLDISVEN